MPNKQTSVRSFDHAALTERVHHLVNAYPFVTLSYIGTSILDRAIPILHIGEGERRVLYVGAHHGMEWITSLVLMRFISEERPLGFAPKQKISLWKIWQRESSLPISMG